MTTTVTERVGLRRRPAAGGSRKLTERVFRIRESGIIAVFVVFVAVTTAIQPSFLNQQNIQFLLINTTVFALLALGETMVVISRNVDLSIGSVLGLSAYVSASLFGRSPASRSPSVFLVGLGIGLACGLANGLMVAIGRVPEPGRHAGHAVHHPRHRHPDRRRQRGDRPDPAERLHRHPAGERARGSVPGHRGRRGDRPRRLLPALLPVRAGAVRDRLEPGRGPAGRHPGRPRGCSPRSRSAARIAGLAGVLWAAQYQTIDSSAGTGYELTVISAVVVGGVAIFGGSGSAVGAAVGALLLTAINSALNVLGISSALAGGHLRLPAAGGHHAGPGDLGPAAGRPATKELRRWHLT